MRVVELYCGIGGVAAALRMSRPDAEVVGAFDISAPAVAVYNHNFPGHPAKVRLIETLPAERLKRLEADLFWLSPPCQPHTRRGHRRDLDDPRSRTFLAALALIAECRPQWVALENVAGFEESEARDRLLDTLADAGYAAPQELLLCPSELGWPNRRPRYYLLAGIRTGDWAPASPARRAGVRVGAVACLDPIVVNPEIPRTGDWAPASPARRAGETIGALARFQRPRGSARSPWPKCVGSPRLEEDTLPPQLSPRHDVPARPGPSPQSENLQLADLLDRVPDPGLALTPSVAERYATALDRVDPADPAGIAACFTSAYGRSPVRSGSYLLRPDGGLRHFSPGEVLRLLGFPADFAFPPGISRQLAWRLAGNSLSLPAVQALLASLPASR